MTPLRQDMDGAEQAGLDIRIKEIIGRLESEADDRVQKKRTVEERWLEDLRQYAGEYDETTEKNLRNSKRSRIFMNLTRPKTDACEARLADMLFPTDDKNWAVDPTEVPRLTEGAGAAAKQALAMGKKVREAIQQGDQEMAAEAQDLHDEWAEIARQRQAVLTEAQKRASGMEKEINDQLTDCTYHIQARDIIRDACKIGTGVLKGPVGSQDRARRSWSQRTEAGDDGGSNVYDLTFVEDPRPAAYWCDPWGFFPDPDARTPEEWESTFERHLMTKKMLRKLAKQPGFAKTSIRRLLREDPNKVLPTYLAELRNISGENQAPIDGMYHVWEYRGPLTAEDMKSLCACMNDDESFNATFSDRDEAEIDPLEEIHAVIWFCQGEVLKFGIHHLDSGESIYSIYNLDKDEASVWGYGIPAIMRDPQRALNGAWRMMMDNAGLSSGPQVEIDPSVVEPGDGDSYDMTPRKVWKRKSNARANMPGIRTYNIESHQAELQAIIEQTKGFIDDITNISMLAQGEQGPHVTQTQGGMALLMNAVNVVFRRMVKNFDDDITVPLIRRFYDWNMQFTDKEEIKGDYEVNARGSSVLLVREIQSQNLMVLAGLINSPGIGPLLKALPLARKLVQSMMISADEIVISDDEFEQYTAQQSDGQAQDPETVKAQLQMQLAEFKAQTDTAIAEMQRDTKMMELAVNQNVSLDKIAADLEKTRMKSQSDERRDAAEFAVKRRMGSGI